VSHGSTLLLNNAYEHAMALDELQFNCKVKLKNDMYVKPFAKEMEATIQKLKNMKKFMLNVDKVQKIYLILAEAFSLKEV